MVRTSSSWSFSSIVRCPRLRLALTRLGEAGTGRTDLKFITMLKRQPNPDRALNIRLRRGLGLVARRPPEGCNPTATHTAGHAGHCRSMKVGQPIHAPLVRVVNGR